MKNRTALEEQLDSFDPGARREALAALAASHRDAQAPQGANVNMHLHTFFSYNAEGFSPSHIAWACRKAGLYAAAVCDFDVLDGLEEFLAAGRTLGLRSAVHLETRAFFPEYADVDISSPGEPGVTYIMGAGFAAVPAAGTPQAAGLDGYRRRARERNVALINRINPHVPEIAVDYERDVLPLAPADAATERHIITAYLHRTKTVFAHAGEAAAYLARILGRNPEETVALLADTPSLEEQLRARLAKSGGLGYEPPSPDTFPPVQHFIDWVASCGAIPMITWLDGTSAGEKDALRMLECLTAKGAAALNIIPDRNWNLSNPDARRIKRENLRVMVEAADRLGLPINIGTEMNKGGLPFVDNLDGEALLPFKATFLRGARVMVGHTILLRYAGLSYISQDAAAEFPDRTRRNAFFEAVGALPPLTEDDARELEDLGPEGALARLRDRIARS